MQCLPSKNFAYDAADSSLALPALALRSASRSSPELYTCLQVTAALQPVQSMLLVQRHQQVMGQTCL